MEEEEEEEFEVNLCEEDGHFWIEGWHGQSYCEVCGRLEDVE